MKLINADKKYIITSKNIINKNSIIDNAVVFDFAISFIEASNNKRKKHGEGQERYNYYYSIYFDTIKKLDKDSFDKNFIDIYKNGIYFINNKNYNVKDIYITKLDDGSVHLYKAGNNNEDILIDQSFSGKKQYICCFRESSVFLELYKNGIIADKNIDLHSPEIKNYINEWNGLRHYAIPELEADRIAKNSFVAKYGS